MLDKKGKKQKRRGSQIYHLLVAGAQILVLHRIAKEREEGSEKSQKWNNS